MNIYLLLIVALFTFSQVSFAEQEPTTTQPSSRNAEASPTHANVAVKVVRPIVMTELPEDFQRLVEFRKELMEKLDRVENDIRLLQDEFDYLPDFDFEISQLKTQQTRDARRIQELKNNPQRSVDEDNEIALLQSYIEPDNANIKRLEDEKKRIPQLEIKLENAKTNFLQTENDLNRVNQQIANFLNIEEERNKFRTMISIAFCVLVAIVIVGFYFIAFKKEEIAESIFAGEKGIQFVTIFLIVIAIILFGIMGILEGKELSALLGGLSGYILGRVGTAAAHEKKPSVKPEQ